MQRGLGRVAWGGVLAAVVLAGCPGGDAPETRDPAPPPAAPAPTPATPMPADMPPGITAEMVQMGDQVYHGPGICFTCHGQNGAGSPIGPALNDRDWIHIGGEFEEIVNVIRTGVDQPQQYASPMPPMGGARLSDEQLRAVAAYVYAISHPG
jgi:mono/diheme cytochrome c family protein